MDKLWKASALLAGFSLLADLVALLRDRILSSSFGASRTLDIYYSAFKIPDFVFNILVLGAVSSAFIPVFIEYYKNDQDKAWKLAQSFLSFAFLGVLILGSVIFIFMEPLASLIAPGFTGRDKDLVISLTRLMLLSPIIFSISTVFGSILQSLEKFLSYAIAPVLYNLGIIVGAVYFVPIFKIAGYSEVMGLGAGVILGALAHLLIQMPFVIRAGFRFKLIFDFAETGLRRVLKLMIPRTLGLGAYSINSIVSNAIASTMTSGSIVIFTLANNLQFVPIAVVGVSVATAIFPKLSGHVAGGEFNDFKRKLYSSLKTTSILVGILAVGIILFREFIIDLLFGAGLFAETNIKLTASVLGILMVGIVSQSLIPIMSRAFYAMQNTKIPVIISVLSIGADILFSLIFSFIFNWDVRGLALAFAIAGNINFILLYLIFRTKYVKNKTA